MFDDDGAPDTDDDDDLSLNANDRTITININQIDDGGQVTVTFRDPDYRYSLRQ